MKYANILFLAGAALALTFSCKEPVDLGPENVAIDTESSITIPAEGGSVTLGLTATVDWAMQGYTEDVQSWLSIEPSSGKAAAGVQTVTITALPNEGYDRTADLVFYGNVMCKAPLTITQPGLGGDGEHITIAEFIEAGDTGTEHVLTGVIGNISRRSNYYGFILKDDTGTISCPFVTDFTTNYTMLHTGDQVSIRGSYSFFEDRQEHQLADGTIESYTCTSTEDIESVTVAEFNERADMFSLYRLTGTISTSVNSTYCSFDITDETGSVYVYSVNNASEYGSVLKQGDKVTLRGAWYEYKDTNEVVDATIESYEAGSGDGGDTGGSEAPTSATSATISEFLAASVNTTDWYELTGTITSITGTSYGNFYMEDATGSVYVYGLVQAWANGTNDQSFSKIGLKVGDTVTIWSLRSEYNGTAQAGGTNPAIYRSHVEGEAPTLPEGSVVLSFPDDNNADNKVNDYVSDWTARIGNYEFALSAFNNYQWNGWTYVRCGRKGNASTASISTTTAMPLISSVEVAIGSRADSNVNSITLTIYSDAGRTTQVGEPINYTGNFTTGGTISFAIPSSCQAANQYYSLVFDCASGTRNGSVEVVTVSYLTPASE